MRSETLGSVVRRLRLAAAPVPHPAGPDADLVRAFARGRDPAAFEAIVRRHGPMVLGVCRRVLREPADADDAFQATFLVLVRKVRSLRQPDRLAGWLHQVAQRTARKLRAARLARARREGELFDVPVGEPPAEFVWRELRPIFDQELDRLPDKLRLPAVLCFLEGHSKGEAARTLGWPEGTLAGRLQQAREKLRVRLAARGLTLSAGALAAALFEGVGSAAVSDRLITSTIQAAATSPAGAAGAGAAGCGALAEGVMHAMFQTKAKAVAVCVLAAGLVGTGTGVVLVPGAGSGQVVAGQTPKEPPEKTTPEKRDTQPTSLPKDTKETAKDLDRAILESELELLRERAAWEERMVQKGYLSEAQAKKTRLDIMKAEAALAKHDTPKPPDPRRTALEDLVRKLEEIAAKTADGVKRGIVPEQELLGAEMTVLTYKLKLLELPDRPAGDPKVSAERRAALGVLVQKAEQIVAKMTEGVKRGIVPPQELHNAEKRMLAIKLKVAELRDREAADPRAAAERRAAYEVTVRKLEQIVAKTAEGVRRGNMPEQELLNAEMTLLRYKFDLLELLSAPVTRSQIDQTSPLHWHVVEERRNALITQKESDLRRAEALHKQGVSSQEEVRRLRIDLARLKAAAAEAAGDHTQALKLREEVVTELDAILAAARALAERRVVPRAEVRAAEVALAEARVEALRAGVRRQLAEIVRVREKELADAKAQVDAKAASVEEVRQAERALAEARQRLAEGR